MNPICELELELKTAVTALQHCRAVGQAAWLHSSTVSAGRTGERRWVAPDHSSPCKTRPRPPQYQQPPVGLVSAARRRGGAMPAADPGPCQRPGRPGPRDEEQLHQLRIGIRRLRTASLRELQASAGPATRPLSPGSRLWSGRFQQLATRWTGSQVDATYRKDRCRRSYAPSVCTRTALPGRRLQVAQNHIVRDTAFRKRWCI